MSKWIVDQLEIKMQKKKIIFRNSKILILGVTFKENCPDTRNSKVLDIIKFLNHKEITPYVHDPYITNEEKLENNFNFLENLPTNGALKFDAIIIAVAHNEYKLIDLKNWKNLVSKNYIFYDLKGILPRELNPVRL